MVAREVETNRTGWRKARRWQLPSHRYSEMCNRVLMWVHEAKRGVNGRKRAVISRKRVKGQLELQNNS